MNKNSRREISALCGLLLLLGLVAQPAATAQESPLPAGASLAVVTPVQSCSALLKQDFTPAADGKVTLNSATTLDTEQGNFCQVKGTLAPSIGFEVNLPLTHWSQRYLQLGCGGLCGSLNLNLGNAHTCAPALRGEFVVASTDMGHSGSMMDASWADDPQKRIDFAYRAHHQTARIAKALIHAFYGQQPRYAYFMGCSDGGREALMAAQRFPEDFDGITAGAPAAFFSFQNSFFHGWNAQINQDADGKAILLQERLPILHQAVLAHCPGLSGVKDGLLQNPYTCHFDPAWVPTCAPNDSQRSNCLTAAEITVARRFYAGAHDGKGASFVLSGMPLGSELQWPVPAQATAPSMSTAMVLPALQHVLLPPGNEPIQSLTDFPLTAANFKRVAELAPLYNATNTNLKPFMARGGKLILWHGLADDSVTPAFSVAYYRGVQRQLGATQTDSFLRLFLLPGVGHCGRGQGYDQIDWLTPLLAWTEQGHAPDQVLSQQVAQDPAGMPPMMAMTAPPSTATRSGAREIEKPQPAAGQAKAHSAEVTQAASQFHVMPQQSSPLAKPGKPVLASRPVYPYPQIARYRGHGDKAQAESYQPVRSDYSGLIIGEPAASQIAPDNQRDYHVLDGHLQISQ